MMSGLRCAATVRRYSITSRSKDPDSSIEAYVKSVVATIGENISIRRFTRYQLGEGASTEPKPA